jgi:hypothetical protein
VFMIMLMLALDFLNGVKIFFDIENEVANSCPQRRHICSRKRLKLKDLCPSFLKLAVHTLNYIFFDL